MDWRETAPEYSDLRTNRPLAELYAANSASLGRPLHDGTSGDRMVISTDMGNVSYLVPSVHPMVKVSGPDVSLHSEDFAALAISDEADAAVLDAAKAMAMTAVDLWLRPAAAGEVRAAFDPAP
jgi:metal-dependent amidase/aminoacylase/carboxypeptidase family protein